jgi:hypothetical protein
MYKIYLILLTFLSLPIFSQNGFITGKITDFKTKEVLPGVNVITDNGKGASSNLDGNYKIEIEPGTYQVSYKFVGYKTEVKKIIVLASKPTVVNIELK